MKLWLLLGAKAGDNKQILALAEAIGVPFEVKQLHFTRASAIPNVLLGARPCSVTPDARRLLAPPWPTAVIASGRRGVPAARWIREQSGGTTRLIHVGRTWAPLDWFDLVITTPQYGLPKRPNVLSNLMPMIQAGAVGDHPSCDAWRERFAELPRPWTAVLVGGNSRPYVLDDAAAVLLGREANARAAASKGSLLVISAPRTGAQAFDALRRTIEAPASFHAWGSGENPYAAVLALADRFIVTGDSASMLADAVRAGKPVDVFELPTRRNLRGAFGAAFRRAAERHAFLRPMFERLVDLGLLTSVRDLGAYHRELRAAGLLDGGAAAAERQKRELERAAECARRLLEI
jgi:uncharacterized protein